MNSYQDIIDYYSGLEMSRLATSELSLKPQAGISKIVYADNRRVVDAALLYDSDRLTKASLVSFLACTWLRRGGYRTWGEIALYYARFHSAAAMLRLVGVAVLGQHLLLRIDESHSRYLYAKKNTSEAKTAGCGGGSHRELWRIFSRSFKDWLFHEAPAKTAAGLSEDPILNHGTAWYEALVEERNDANYLNAHAGLFFPETDFSGDEGFIVDEAKSLGAWDCLRTDSSPFATDDPPEAWFFKEMIAWDLLKYVIAILTNLHGQKLLEEYLWLIRKLDANSELSMRMADEISKGK